MGRGLLCNKINELERIISEEKPHVIGISEAQFENSQDIIDLRMKKYSIHFSDTLFLSKFKHELYSCTGS